MMGLPIPKFGWTPGRAAGVLAAGTSESVARACFPPRTRPHSCRRLPLSLGEPGDGLAIAPVARRSHRPACPRFCEAYPGGGHERDLLRRLWPNLAGPPQSVGRPTRGRETSWSPPRADRGVIAAALVVGCRPAPRPGGRPRVVQCRSRRATPVSHPVD
jgi:hypothetical protein